jgi:hypothetical protein
MTQSRTGDSNSSRGEAEQFDITMLPCILLFFAAERYFVESVATAGLTS